MESKLVFYRWEDDSSIQRKLMSDAELLKMIDSMDYVPYEIIKVLDVSDPDNIFEIHYVGWQPGCLIEFKDDKGNVVVRGYGEDH